ncbi:MAG: hypothetical protein ACR2GT_09725 [Gaiellaceae bacterium]
MDLLLVLGVIAVALFLLVVLGIGRMVWRIVRDNEQLEPGGSYSRQLFGRDKRTPRRSKPK